MQIQILKPGKDGKHYPNYDEMIKNATDNDERDYLIEVKERHEKWKANGFEDGFNFGIVYTTKMACGHYELFQHPIYRHYGKEPDDSNIIESIEDVINIIHLTKAEGMKCTRCICGFR